MTLITPGDILEKEKWRLYWEQYSKKSDWKELMALLKNCTPEDREWKQKIIQESFYSACYRGQLDLIKGWVIKHKQKLLEAGFSPINIHENSEKGFVQACDAGHLEVVKFLTISKELQKAGESWVDIHTNDEQAFRWTCAAGHLNVVKFLLFDQALLSAHQPVNIHAINEEAFIEACCTGHQELIIWLLHDEEVKKKYRSIDIHVEDDTAFNWLCWHGELELVSLLTNAKIMTEWGYEPVKPQLRHVESAVQNDYWNVVEYLVLHADVEISEQWKDSFWEMNSEQAEKLQHLINIRNTHRECTHLLQENKEDTVNANNHSFEAKRL